MGNPQFRAQTAELGAVWDLEPGLLGGFSVGHGGRHGGMVEERRGTGSSDLWSGGPRLDLNARAGSVPRLGRTKISVTRCLAVCPWMNLTVQGHHPSSTSRLAPCSSNRRAPNQPTKDGSRELPLSPFLFLVLSNLATARAGRMILPPDGKKHRNASVSPMGAA